MYDIRQFRPTLYALVALGFTGFGVATVTPMLWLFGMAMLLLNAYLLRTGAFRPMPRWLAGGLTLLAAIYTGFQIVNDARPIFPIGNFLVILQLIKLYEQRGNRDYAQLLVLSLLLMVAAAISTASLLFGIIFVLFLLLSPYACLLFHLKVETDHAKRQMGLDEKLANPMTLRQDQRYLNRSMTRLTAFVAIAAISMAVLVFVFFPRMPGGNMLMFRFTPSMAASGMSSEMNMQSVTRVQQNTTEIGWLRVSRNGEPVTGGQLYLRGMVYDGDPRSSTRWSWQRASQQFPAPLSSLRPGSEESLLARGRVNLPDNEEQWVQEFTPLKPTNVAFLLALPGAHRISVSRPVKVGYVAGDGLIQLDSSLMQELYYRVVSSGRMPYELPRWAGPTTQPGNPNSLLTESVMSSRRGPLVPSVETVDQRIVEYARRPEVSGIDAEGKPLAATLSNSGYEVPANAEAVATNIERHLQTRFTYTLDLGGNAPRDSTIDPVVHFLYNSRTGWCEHYAYAMTLMCQSLGLKARLVSGYKCDEYNAIGGYFIVRQSHAHAWVEVLIREGNELVWKTFDPTSGIDANANADANSVWKRLTHFIDYLEHTWANSVVAYDSAAQSGMLENVESKLVRATIQANTAVRDSGGWMAHFSKWFSETKYSITEGIIVVLLSVMGLAAIGLTLWYVIQRVKLTRRARRIGLDVLDAAEARRLARQLGFYDELTRILEKRDIVRAPHLTPLEFGHSLSYLPQEAFDTIVRLTRVFYRIRYGSAELSAGQRRTLNRVIDRLHRQLLPQSRGSA